MRFLLGLSFISLLVGFFILFFNIGKLIYWPDETRPSKRIQRGRKWFIIGLVTFLTGMGLACYVVPELNKW